MDSSIELQQIKEFDSLWHKLLDSNKINVCTNRLEGATPLEISILRIVGENPEIILREICQRFGVVSSTLTSAINRLEKRNLLNRTISARDLRSFGLRLTEEGRVALAEHIEREEDLIKSMLSAFKDSKERTQFVELFKKMVDKIFVME